MRALAASLCRRRDACAGALIVLAVLAMNAPGLVGGLDPDPMLVLSGLAWRGQDGLLPGGPGWTDPNTGTTTQALGHLSALDLLHGVMPWWNPYSGAGMPLAGSMQPASLLLPFVLLLAFQKGMLWLRICMQVTAGLGTYALCRQLGLGRLGALAGGLFYAANGTFGWHGAYAPALPPAFLPLILLGVERAAAAGRAARPGGVGLLAVALAYSLYAGFPETAYTGALLVAGWSLFAIGERAAAGRRLAVALRLVRGGAIGLALAAPILIAFADFLHGATMGLRASGFGLFAYPPRFTVLPFFPHIFGLPSGLWIYDTEHVTPNLFALNGGWLGLTLSFLATLAVLTPGPRRGLRWLLGGWIVVSLLKTMSVPGITELVNLIPGVPLIPWFRYGPPAWEMAAAVLAAMALDDWRRGGPPAGWRLALALALVAGVAAATLAAARAVFAALLRTTPHYAWYLGLSVGPAVLVLTLVAVLLRRPPAGRWPPLLLAAAVLEPLLLCFLPGLAGRRQIALDLGTVRYLQHHLGLQRFVSWGSIQANYGAYWRIASLNYEYVPIPQSWWQHVHDVLAPHASVFAWRGALPVAPDGAPLAGAALRQRLEAYQADGAAYVVVRSGLPGPEQPQATAGGERRALLLPPGGWLAGTVTGPLLHAGTVEAASVLIGTYGGASTGRLVLHLCTTAAGARVCREGSAEVSGAPDNAPLRIRLDTPLPLAAGAPLAWRIEHQGGSTGVAIWLYPDPPGSPPALASPWGTQAGQPSLLPDYGPQSGVPRLVYGGAIADVWQLPHPRPYFSITGGPCTLRWQNREHLQTSCAGPATLVRLELFYAGWRAWVNNVPQPIGAEGIFQRLDLPAGTASVRFAFAPPYIRFGFALFVLGLVALTLPAALRRRQHHRETVS
jgi:hypothetical protein